MNLENHLDIISILNVHQIDFQREGFLERILGLFGEKKMLDF